MQSGKRELLARGLLWTGITALTDRLPQRDTLLVLNYHRIALPVEDPFDPGVFSATGDQLYEQIGYLKRRVSLITLDEALAFVESAPSATPSGCRVLITFDDGYLDNYQVAFPILRSHGVQGAFFLVTGLVGSSEVPWWDRLAYVLGTARRRRFVLRYPAELAVDLEAKALSENLQQVLRLYKSPANLDPVRFMCELQRQAKVEQFPLTPRRFLNWNEAREMIQGGMAIGSHTHSHPVLTQLSPERQRFEMTHSRRLLTSELGTEAQAMAYPVGSHMSFSEVTQQAAKEAGYRVAFSAHGGTNRRSTTRQYDVKRVDIGDQSSPRFQVQTAICSITGSYWP